MSLILEIIFIILVLADTVLTYRAIKSGRGVEVAFAKRYIKNVPITIIITAIGTLLILLLTAETPIILLLPIAAFGYACWNNWRVLHGR